MYPLARVPLRSTEHRGTHVSPRVTRACTRVARARSKPVGRLAGTGDENLASASRCRPPDSRSKLSLSPAALTLRARFTPNFLPGPLSRSPRVLTLRAHTARFSTKLSRRVGTRRSLLLPLHHRHHYHRRHRWIPSFPATTTTIRRDHLRRFHVLPVATRRCVAYGASPPNFPLLSRSESPSFSPIFLLSFQFPPLARAEHATLSSAYILCALPSPLLLQVSSNFFHPTPPPLESTTTLPRHKLYISRARGSFHPPINLSSLSLSFSSSLSLSFSCSLLALGMHTMY